MPVVPKFSEQALPQDIKDLFAHARAGKIDPASFLEAMDQQPQLDYFLRLLYTGKAFDLTLSQVKELEIRRGRGLTDEVAVELIHVLDELETAQRDPEK